MARPIKDGFDYFPFDVNLDNKFKSIESVFKNDGFVWIIKFWQQAYQSNKGEVNLEGYHGVFHAENCRITIEKQKEILEMAIEMGLIYKTDHGTYTSNGIQKRIKFLLAERERWRNKSKIELSTIDNPRDNPGIRGESKVKESKVNKSKEKNNNNPTTTETENEENAPIQNYPLKKDLPKKDLPKKEPPKWKTDFSEYQKDLKAAVDIIMLDAEFLRGLERAYPEVDIVETLKKSIRGYWNTEDGWSNRKGKKTTKLDWKATLRNVPREDWRCVFKQPTYGVMEV